MQKLAEKIVEPSDAANAVADAAAKDEQTRKQINDIQDALNGKEPAPAAATGSDKVAEKSSDKAEKLATDAVAKAVSETPVASAAAVPSNNDASKKRSPGEIPANLSEETGAALKRFDSLLNGSAKLDRPDFASRLKAKPYTPAGGTTSRADKEPTAPVARVERGEEPGVRKINKASISRTDPKPEFIPEMKKADLVEAKSADFEAAAKKLAEALPVEAKADAKPLDTKSDEKKADAPKPAETKKAEAPVEKQTEQTAVAPAEQPTPAPQQTAVPDMVVEEAGSEIVGRGDSQVDFFAIRRSLRQLQFNYSINKPHDDAIRDDFESVLASFSKMSVMYQTMSEDHAKRADQRDDLIKARNESRELSAELAKAQQQERSAEARRKKDLEAFSQLTARQNASRSELREAQEQIEALKREMKEQAQEFESKHSESMKLVEEASLAEAEKTVLRESLTEACDKIAELLSGELQNESTIQALEDELEHYRVNAAQSEAG